MVDTRHLKCLDLMVVGVQVPLPAPERPIIALKGLFLCLPDPYPSESVSCASMKLLRLSFGTFSKEMLKPLHFFPEIEPLKAIYKQ